MKSNVRLRMKMVAATAVAAAAASACGFYVNDDGSIALPEGAVANTYPSLNNVNSTEGNQVGPQLQFLIALLCGVSTPGDDGVDIVLQAPHGTSVLLTTGFSTPEPTNVLLVPEDFIDGIIGGIGGPFGPGGPIGLTPAAIHRHGGFYVPKHKKARVLRLVAKRAHLRGAQSLRAAHLVSGPEEGIPLEDCLDSSVPLFLADSESAEGVTLPSPAPAGPYATGLDSFEGVNPIGNWKLWINSVAPDVSELRAFHHARPAITVAHGGVDSWYLLPIAPAAEEPEQPPFEDDADFTATGQDTAESPLTLTMHVKHKDDGSVTPTGNVDFIECTNNVCDGSTIGSPGLIGDQHGNSVATLTLPAGSAGPGEHRYKAIYYGDVNFGMIITDPVAITVPDVPAGL